jgi:microcystin degradation protein MlrC
MRIFAAGIATETNMFSPIPTGLEDFFVQSGLDAARGHVLYPGLDLSVTWGRLSAAGGHEFTFSLNAWAEPSGLTLASAYESLRDQLLTDLRAAMPVDVVLLMLHGAMVAHGYDDCEEDLIGNVRRIVGPDAAIGVELDLHCHLTEVKIAAADIVITYKEYPHVDINDRARELFDLSVAIRRGEIRPTMAVFDCRMCGLYPTSRDPMRGFVDDMRRAERLPGVLSISFAHSFHFADLPHVGAKVLAVTNDDAALAKELAAQFGVRAYRLRKEIGVDVLSLPMEEAFARASASSATPVVIADQSDNTGAGAPGDATFALRWVLDHDVPDVAMAIFYDPELVRIAKKAGRGARLPVRLGGKLGPSSGDPVDMEVTVLAVLEDYMHVRPQRFGEAMSFPVGDIVALRCGTTDIVVGSKRCQCFCPSIFRDLGIDPQRKRLLIPKSTQHFYGAFAPVASQVIYMAGPGAVPPNPRQLSYRRLDTKRLYPWNENPLER